MTQHNQSEEAREISSGVLTGRNDVSYEGLRPTSSLHEAREWLEERLVEDKVMCPCCHQFAKVYSRPLNRTMALSLAWLAMESGPDRAWVDVPEVAPKYVTSTNQHTTLRYWGLVERRDTVDPTRKYSGIWRPTEKGVAFVNEEITVPFRAVTYDNMVLEMRGPMIKIHDPLPGFNYREIMEWSP